MLIYTFYNADLINIVKGKSELSTSFVDDCAFVAVADIMDKAHSILKDMMECPNRGLDWSHTHNSPFEITELVVMDFARTPKDVTSSQLTLDRLSGDKTHSAHLNNSQ